MVRSLSLEVPGEALSSVLYRARMIALHTGVPAGNWEFSHEPVPGVEDTYLLTLRAGLPQIAGYEVLGYQHQAAVIPAPGLPTEMAPAHDPAAQCFVCGTRRSLKHFFLRSADGNMLLVGTRCLGKLFDVVPVEGERLIDTALLDPTSRLKDTIAKVQFSLHVETTAAIAMAMLLDKEHGYMNRQRANSLGSRSTAEQMEVNFRSIVELRHDQFLPVKEWPEEIANRLLPAAIMRAWVLEEMDTSTEFAQRLRDAVSRPTVTTHAFGLIAALPVTYARNARIEDALAAGDPTPGEDYLNEHFGDLGQRLTLSEVIVEDLRLLDTGSYLVTMRGPEGHRLTWFASRTPMIGNVEVSSGQHVTLTGTIRRHGEFRGVKDTTVNRCKITPASR